MNRYSVSDISYDYNGNIVSLQRNGITGLNSFGLMDHLTYFYNGNQLIGVNDAVADLPENCGDFSDNGNEFIPLVPVPTSHEYSYNENGAMIGDKNKGIKNIAYNYLGLPKEIDFGLGNKIQYSYDSKGNKLRKMVLEAYNPVLIKHYCGNIEIANDELESVFTSEGRVVLQDNGVFRYDYTISDHLGNARVSFTDANESGNAEIIQENHYYPFGVTLGGQNYYNSSVSSENKYKFNNKESQEELGLHWYDHGFRFYDPQLGRWHVVDPLAEVMPAWSPYSYCFNNPVMLVDPDGRDVETTKEGWAVIKDALNATLGKEHPFGFNEETGLLTYDKNFNTEALDEDFKKSQIITNFASLINDHTVKVTVDIVGNDDDIKLSNGSTTTLFDEKASGITIYSPDSRDSRVYISNNPLVNRNGVSGPSYQPKDDMGMTALHEIGGHAYFHKLLFGFPTNVNQNNILTESFHRDVQSIYRGKHLPNYIKNQEYKGHERK